MRSESVVFPPRPELLGAKRITFEEADQAFHADDGLFDTAMETHAAQETDITGDLPPSPFGGIPPTGSLADEISHITDDEAVPGQGSVFDWEDWVNFDPEPSFTQSMVMEQANEPTEKDSVEGEDEDQASPTSRSVIDSSKTSTPKTQSLNLFDNIATEPVRVRSVKSSKSSSSDVLVASPEPQKGLALRQSDPRLSHAEGGKDPEAWIKETFLEAPPDPFAYSPKLSSFYWWGKYGGWHASKEQDMLQRLGAAYRRLRRTRFDRLVIQRNTYDADMLHDQRLQQCQIALAELTESLIGDDDEWLNDAPPSQSVALKLLKGMAFDTQTASDVNFVWCLSEAVSYLRQELLINMHLGLYISVLFCLKVIISTTLVDTFSMCLR